MYPNPLQKTLHQNPELSWNWMERVVVYRDVFQSNRQCQQVSQISLLWWIFKRTSSQITTERWCHSRRMLCPFDQLRSISIGWIPSFWVPYKAGVYSMSSTQSLPKNAMQTAVNGTPRLPLFALPCHAYDTHATGSMVHLRHIFAKDRVEMDFLDYPLRK